ncbi:MAG: hypothetical protein ACO395_09740 [Pontimonas sp.]
MTLTSEIRSLGSLICCDTETALAPLSFQGRHNVRLVQFFSEHGERWYDLKTFSDDQWAELQQVLEDPTITWIFQNALFDYRVFLGCGIRLRGRIEDTLIQSALINNGLPNNSNALEAIAQRVLKVQLDKTLQSQDWMNADLNDADMAYAMGDVRITYRCWEEQRAMVKTQGLQRVYDLECSLVPVVAEMEHTGMLVSVEQAKAAIAKLEGEIEASLGEFLDLLDAQLREVVV